MRGTRTVRWWALAALCVATALAAAAALGWPFELFSHFRVQYAAGALLLAAVFVVMRRPWPASLAALLAVFHALPALQRSVASEPAAGCGGPAFTVVTANLQFSNVDRRRFVEWLAEHPADVVVVQEVTAAWAGELSRIAAYPHQKLLAREDPYGIGILSRWPLEDVEREDFAGDGLPSLAGRVAIEGEPLRFLALHTHWPIVPRLAQARDRSLGAAARLLRSEGGPAVAMGDLNLTMHSPEFARFLAASGLRDATHGAWWRPTWRAGFWPLALRIDHVLVSPGVCVESTAVGPSIGSDHRPVIARLRFSAP